jgi:plastocyanin
MHRSRPVVVLFLVALLAACSGAASSAPASDDGDGAASGGGGETVSMAGFAFSPSDLTIQAGTTVTFTDTGGHTVTEGIDGEAADDPIVDEDGGSDIDVTFDEPGTYNITCKLHPDMNMTITVEG